MCHTVKATQFSRRGIKLGLLWLAERLTAPTILLCSDAAALPSRTDEPCATPVVSTGRQGELASAGMQEMYNLSGQDSPAPNSPTISAGLVQRRNESANAVQNTSALQNTDDLTEPCTASLDHIIKTDRVPQHTGMLCTRSLCKKGSYPSSKVKCL